MKVSGAFVCEGRGGRGERYFLESRKYQRTCVWIGRWLFPLARQLVEKGVGIRCASKLAPGFQAPFSVCFANPRSAAPRTAALVACAQGVAVFSAEKTSGRIGRCGGAIVKSARFAAAKRRPSASATTQHCGRPGRLRRPGARSAQKKRAEAVGASLLASADSTLFFNKPAETSQLKDCLSGGL